MGSKTLLTFGTYDIPHVGHALLLRRCEGFGRVVVGVNSDELAERFKGRRPIFSLAERMALIEALGYTVHPILHTARDLIESIEPQYLAVGSDWVGRDWLSTLEVDEDYLDEHGIYVLYLPHTDGISTSLIRERCSP